MIRTQSGIPEVAVRWQKAQIITWPSIQVLTNIDQLKSNTWVMVCRGEPGAETNYLALLTKVRNSRTMLPSKELTVVYNSRNLDDYAAYVSRYGTLYGYCEQITTRTFDVAFDTTNGDILRWSEDPLRFLTSEETDRVLTKIASDIEKITHNANESGYYVDISGVAHLTWQKRDAANARFLKTRPVVA